MLSDWKDFVLAIEQAKLELGCSKSGAWFRGVRNSKYRLYPTILRPRASIGLFREKDIYEEFTDFEGEATHSDNSWDRLVKLQHYGVPTRLMDWTEVFGVALFFATRKFNGKAPEAPAIWLINPFSIAKLARKSDDKRIGVFHKETDLDYYDRFIHGRQKQWPFELPMPYRPPKLTPRIRAQKGFFTVHGLDKRPLDALYRKNVRQVRIPIKLLENSAKFLELAGIDSLSMFPDFEGFSRKISDKYQ